MEKVKLEVVVNAKQARARAALLCCAYVELPGLCVRVRNASRRAERSLQKGGPPTCPLLRYAPEREQASPYRAARWLLTRLRPGHTQPQERAPLRPLAPR